MYEKVATQLMLGGPMRPPLRKNALQGRPVLCNTRFIY